MFFLFLPQKKKEPKRKIPGCTFKAKFWIFLLRENRRALRDSYLIFSLYAKISKILNAYPVMPVLSLIFNCQFSKPGG